MDDNLTPQVPDGGGPQVPSWPAMPASPPLWTTPTLSPVPEFEAVGPPQPDSETIPTPPSPPRPGRARLAVLGVIGVALLAGVGVGVSVLYGTFFGDGGADSPQATSDAFTTALVGGDIVAVAALVEPQEMTGLQDLIASGTAAAQRAGLAKERLQVNGLKIDLTGVTSKVKMESDHVARVTYSGTVKVAWNVSELPSAIRSMLSQSDDPAKSSFEFNVDEVGLLKTTGIMMVERGDGWYISPSMTAAEGIIGGQDVPKPNYGALLDNSTTNTGAKSPDDALGELFDAAQTGDAKRIIAALPSDTYGFLRVYQGSIVDAIDRTLSKDDRSFLASDPITLDDADIATQAAGDGIQRLTVKSANGDYGLRDGTRGTWSYADFGFETSESSDKLNPTTNERFKRTAARFGIEGIPLVAREVDGGWKIDPYRSIFDLGIRLSESLNAELINVLRQSTDGTPAGRIEPGKPQTMKVGKLGYAVFEMATEEGKIYTVNARPIDNSGTADMGVPSSIPFSGSFSGSLGVTFLGFGGSVGLGSIERIVLGYDGLVAFTGAPGQRVGVGDISAADGAEFEVTVAEIVTEKYTLGTTADANNGPKLITFDWQGGPMSVVSNGDEGYSYLSFTTNDPFSPTATWSALFNGDDLPKGRYTVIVSSPQLVIDALKEGFDGGRDSASLSTLDQATFTLTSSAAVTFTATTDPSYSDVSMLYIDEDMADSTELNDTIGTTETATVDLFPGGYTMSCNGVDASGVQQFDIACTITATITR